VAPAVGRPTPLGEAPGLALVRLDVVGTVAFVAATAVASAWSSDAADLANLVVSGVLFVGGCVAFTVGFLRAAGRSRVDDVDIAGVVYLTGSAPRSVRRVLLGLWFVQIAVAAASVVAVAPPFGVMAPVWGIGLITLWGAWHGVFPPRPREDRLGRRSAP
jgi:hypothetical protein